MEGWENAGDLIFETTNLLLDFAFTVMLQVLFRAVLKPSFASRRRATISQKVFALCNTTQKQVGKTQRPPAKPPKNNPPKF